MKINSNTNMVNRKEICDEFVSYWQGVEILVKKTRSVFGDNHPVTDSIDLAAIHMMNAVDEAEKDLYVARNQLDKFVNDVNKLEINSLNQIFQVVRGIQWSGPRTLKTLNEAYQIALQGAKNKFGVERNTIADACTRRLQLNTDKFLELVQKWLNGDATSLIDIIKLHTEKSIHNQIDKFFTG